MKRIIDGVTYNTDTSTLLAKSAYGCEYNHQPFDCEGTLYQTRGGAFFVHEQIDLGFDPDDNEQIVKDRFAALSPHEAQKWIMTGEVEIFHNPFEDPPEARAESEKGATIYVRVPASLKRRVDEAAEESNLSSNAWATRCVERCLSKGEALKDLMEIVFVSQCIHEKDWEPNKMRVALSYIYQRAETQLDKLLGSNKEEEFSQWLANARNFPFLNPVADFDF